MGCTASKDAVETNRKSRSASQIGRGMTMPVQAQGESNNGYHMVALTSSTYGILNADTPKIDVSSISSHDAFYEKLKYFEVPDEMVAKPWSEVSLSLPKIPPPTRTDSPRRTDNLRRMDSPRLQTRGLDSPRQMSSFRGIDSPRQRGSFGRTDSPRRLPSQATKNDHETVDTWELMDGLDEDGKTLAKLKLKPVERIPRSPVIKPFERSITFSTIHTLSELDSADPSKAIAPGPAGDFSKSLIAVDSGGKENTNPVRTMTRSASSPMVPKRDEITVRLTPSSPSLAAKVAAPSDDPSRPRQPTVAPMMLTPEANAAIQEVSDAVSKALLPPPSPSERSVGVKKVSDSPRPRQPTIAQMNVAPEVTATLQEGNKVGRKSHLPPPSPLLRSVGTKQSSNSPRPRQLTIPPMTMALEVNGSLQEGSNGVSKSHLPPPSPLLRSVGTKSASAMEVRNRPPGSQHPKSPMVKAVNSPMSLNTKLEAEVERAISEERGVSGRQSFSKQPAALTSLVPDSGRVRTVAASLSQEGGVARPQATPRRVEVNETSSQSNRQVPRFASPIHVLSLAASFDLENQKNSVSHLDLKAPEGPTAMNLGGLGQSGRKSFSKQQSMPSPSIRAVPSSGQRVGLQSQTSAPNHGRYGRLDTLNVSVGSQKDSLPLNSDLMASFEEALEMYSTDERHNVRDRKGGADSKRLSSVDTNGMSHDRLEEGVFGDQARQSNGIKGANENLTVQGEDIVSRSSADKGTVLRKKAKPDPWARFEMKCPPAGEHRVVLYTTSLRGIRKTFEDCNNARFIFGSFNIDIDERDVSIHAEFRQELKELAEKPVPVPQVFIKGRYIGGTDIITQIHEDGTLATLLDGLPPQLSRGECDGCGGVRFVPCSDCSGSTKVLNHAKEVVRCSECNENGLMRCPICY